MSTMYPFSTQARKFGVCLFLALIWLSSPVIAQTGCTLSWTPQNDPELAGHIIYAGLARNQYRVSVQVSKTTTSITCDDAAFASLPKPAVWCFTITSINSSGRESTVEDLTHLCTAEPLVTS